VNGETSSSLCLKLFHITTINLTRDIPEVTSLFPNRFPNAPHVLSSKFARIVSVIVGYDVALSVKFAPEMRDEVHEICQSAKETGAPMNIFGVQVPAEDDPIGPQHQVEVRHSNLSWDRVEGEMLVTPTLSLYYPTILGVVARRFK
jgi:hypothetical protein